MPTRAFVPVPLTDAQPRVYKGFRGRQLQGILLGAGGAVLSLAIFGVRDFTGYALAFVAAIPGFAYGYYQPQGKPVEYWIQVLVRYYSTPQIISANPRTRRRWGIYAAQIGPILSSLMRPALHPRPRRKERVAHGR